jgi:hypothetical protein
MPSSSVDWYQSVQCELTGCTIYFQFITIINLYMFWAGLLLIIRRYYSVYTKYIHICLSGGRGQLKCDGTRAETRSCLSTKRTSPFKSAGASFQSTTGSRDVCISGSNAGHTMFQGGVKGTDYPLHSSVSPSLPLPCVTVCHHISNEVYYRVVPPDDEQ